GGGVVAEEQNIDRTFGQVLRAYRENRGLTLSEMATKSHLREDALSEYESGQRIPGYVGITRIIATLSLTPTEQEVLSQARVRQRGERLPEILMDSPSLQQASLILLDATNKIAQADPANIQEVAAAQIGLLTSYYTT